MLYPYIPGRYPLRVAERLCIMTSHVFQMAVQRVPRCLCREDIVGPKLGGFDAGRGMSIFHATISPNGLELGLGRLKRNRFLNSRPVLGHAAPPANSAAG